MVVALPQHTWTNALPFSSEHQRNRPGHVDVGIKVLRRRVHAVDPQASLFEGLDQTNQIAHSPDGNMIERSGRYFRHH